MRNPFKSTLVICLAVVALLSGCAPKGVELPRLFWPPPPEEPRLEWIGAYASQDDFPKSGFERFKESLLGKPPLAKFKTPFGIVADGQGKVFIGDLHARNIKVYDFNAKTVDFLFREPPFDAPLGMARDRAGNLYVADGRKTMVMVFTATGEPLFSFGGPDLFVRPAYLALNERLGRIYVADGGGHKVVVFDMQGNHLFNIAGQKRGPLPGIFHGPQGLAIDKEDRLFVCDMFNSRIQVFDADGNYLYNFGERGDAFYQFDNPKDLAFDSEGSLHILDGRKATVSSYLPDGTLLLETGGGRTTHKLGFVKPTSIYIDQNDRMYITDGGLNQRFAVWQFITEDYLKKHPITEEDRKAIEALMEEGRRGQGGAE